MSDNKPPMTSAKAKAALNSLMSAGGGVVPLKPARNTLGSLDGEMFGPATPPALETIARRFFHRLIDQKHLPALETALALLAREQAIMDEHSIVLQQRKIDDASHQYAQNPTPETFETLRHAKTLSATDHSLCQQHARNRVKEIMAQISPLCREVLRRGIEVLEEAAESLWKSETALYESWNLPPVASPLCRGLRSCVKDFAGSNRATVPFEALPELVAVLLKLDAEKAQEARAKAEQPIEPGK